MFLTAHYLSAEKVLNRVASFKRRSPGTYCGARRNYTARFSNIHETALGKCEGVKLCEGWEVLVRYFDLIPELISPNATPGVLDIVVTSLDRAKFRDVV